LQALQKQQSPQERLKAKQQLLKKGETELSIKTALQRIQFMSQLWHTKEQQGTDAVPVVAGITFAAPRVGNPAYANAFKARSLNDPLSVKEPLTDEGYNDSMVSTFTKVGRCLARRMLSSNTMAAVCLPNSGLVIVHVP
jgi:hypothetical protein